MILKANQTFLCFVKFYNTAHGLNLQSPKKKILHCYKNLFPWTNENEFRKYLASSVIYNNGGLIALNKPFGIKIHGHDKPGTRYAADQRYVIPSIKECSYTVEDALPTLEEYLNLKNLRILKSAEKYTSGVVLLGSSDDIATRVTKAFTLAKQQKKPHLVHWGITVGYPVEPFREERVGIKFIESETGKERQPIIVTEASKRARKRQLVQAVQVECRTLCVNQALSTSLIQIASSSVTWHFVRVYVSTQMAPLLGDIMYGSRMKTLLGVPLQVQLQNAFAYGPQKVPDKMLEALNLPKGEAGAKMIPTMLHLRSIILPNFEEKGKDLVITANLPPFFEWTAERLNLINACK